MSALSKSVPGVATAKLPMTYESAKSALAQCEQLDECQDWADKAEALASYAKQAGDETLRKTADRIQARAVQRCGELLAAIKPAKGGARAGAGRPSKTAAAPQRDRKSMGGCPPVDFQAPTRKEAARDAGLSEHQQKTALRVAAVPEKEFKMLVEGDDPPTVTALAEIGKKARPIQDEPLIKLGRQHPVECEMATTVQDQVRALADLARLHAARPEAIMLGTFPSERVRLRKNAEVVGEWLNDLVQAMEGSE